MITTDDYFVRLIDLPPRVRGITVPNDDGTFSIYINAMLSSPMQRKAYDHEVRHIVLDHLYQDRPIEDIESEADGVVLRDVDITAARDQTHIQKKEKMIPCYDGLRGLEHYLRSIGALTAPIEDIGEKMH